MPKLIELKGSEALKHKDVDVYRPISTEEKCVFNYGKEIGYNQAIDQFSALNIDLDEEALYIFLKSIKGCNIAHLDTDWCEIVNVRQLAQALCAKAGEIIRIKRE